jgi:hypothetical protein
LRARTGDARGLIVRQRAAGSRRGKRHAEGRAGADRALHLDPPAELLDQPLHDVEPQPDPAVGAPVRAVGLPVHLEDRRQVLGGDPDAGVAHDDGAGIVADRPEREGGGPAHARHHLPPSPVLVGGGSGTVAFSSVVVMALLAEAIRAAAARSSPGRGDPGARRMPSAGARALAGSGRSSVVSDAGGK